MTKKTLIAAAAFAAVLALTGCGEKDDPDSTPKPTPSPTMSPELQSLTENTVDAVITLEGGDEIRLELYPDLAPQTVENFIDLADSGLYDGTIFHRVIEGFVIQAGGYDEDLNEVKAGAVEGEFAENGFDNPLTHTRGVISMARTMADPDSATSQFFIVQEDAPYLDGKYAAFGKVADDESMMVVDDIASERTGTSTSLGLEDVPVSPIVIESVTIESSGGSSSGTKSSGKTKSGNKTSGSGSVDDTETDRDSSARGGAEDGYSDDLTDEELNDILNSLNEQMDSDDTPDSSGSSSSSGASSSGGLQLPDGNSGGIGHYSSPSGSSGLPNSSSSSSSSGAARTGGIV